MAAVTIGARKYGVLNNKRVVQATITFNVAYATGGDSIAPNLLGLKEVTQLIEASHDLLDPTVVVVPASRDNGISVQLQGTKTAPLLKCFETNGVEVLAAVDQSLIATTLWFLGS